MSDVYYLKFVTAHASNCVNVIKVSNAILINRKLITGALHAESLCAGYQAIVNLARKVFYVSVVRKPSRCILTILLAKFATQWLLAASISADITARVHQMIMQQWHAATTTRQSYTPVF